LASPLLIDQGLPVAWACLVGQGQAMFAQGVLQRAEKPAPEGLAQRLDGQEEFGPAIAPAVAGVEAAGGDQTVQVRVLAEVAAPGMQGHEQAGHGTQVTLIGTQRQQARAGGVEQHLRQRRAVELP
jgi:hypothetical protein